MRHPPLIIISCSSKVLDRSLMNIHQKSLMPQQVMSSASAIVAQSRWLISRPTTIHHKNNVRRKSDKNCRKVVENEENQCKSSLLLLRSYKIFTLLQNLYLQPQYHIFKKNFLENCSKHIKNVRIMRNLRQISRHPIILWALFNLEVLYYW